MAIRKKGRVRFTVNGRKVRVVVVVTVQEVYVHCAKALRRAGLWAPDTWAADADLPSAACIVKDHVGLDVDGWRLRVSRHVGGGSPHRLERHESPDADARGVEAKAVVGIAAAP